VGRCLNGVVEEADGRGEPGRRDGGAGGGAAVGRKGRSEVGDDPDRWAPPVGGCVRGRERRSAGPRDKWAGPRWNRNEGGEVGRGVGEEGLFCFFSFSFSLFFKSFLKPIFSTLLNSNLLHNFLQLF
jgi:hypothetical protein